MPQGSTDGDDGGHVGRHDDHDMMITMFVTRDA